MFGLGQAGLGAKDGSATRENSLLMSCRWEVEDGSSHGNPIAVGSGAGRGRTVCPRVGDEAGAAETTVKPVMLDLDDEGSVGLDESVCVSSILRAGGSGEIARAPSSVFVTE
jgi:hypothetical protein